MARALTVMVLSLGTLLYSFRASTRSVRRIGPRHSPVTPFPVVRDAVYLLTTAAGPRRPRPVRAIGALLLACVVIGVGLGLVVVALLSTLSGGISGLLQ